MSQIMYLPKHVIMGLFRYLPEGGEVEMTTEDLNGEQIHRWIANNVVLWTEPVNPEQEDQ